MFFPYSKLMSVYIIWIRKCKIKKNYYCLTWVAQLFFHLSVFHTASEMIVFISKASFWMNHTHCNRVTLHDKFSHLAHWKCCEHSSSLPLESETDRGINRQTLALGKRKKKGRSKMILSENFFFQYTNYKKHFTGNCKIIKFSNFI